MSTGISGVMNGLCRSLVLTTAVVALLSSAAPVSAAPHAAITLPCQRCHTLDMQNVDPMTGSLLRAAPNLSIMKDMTNYVDANGDGIADAPDILGCYLCHTQGDRLTGVPMKNVQSDFMNQTSMHAIGRRIITSLDTQNEFQSNWTGNALAGWTGGTNVQDELQCVWCHNMSGGTYPDHYPGAAVPNPVNPNLLYFVSVADNLTMLCYLRCHVGASFPNGGQTVTVPAMGHIGWAAFSYNNTPLTKADDTMKTGRGTLLKTADCTLCHNTHSSNKTDLIRDGFSEGGAAIDETNCTAVCHDTPAQWNTKGHGQYPVFSVNVSCGPCHSTAVSHRSGNGKRFAFPEDTDQSSIQYNGMGTGSGDGLDNDMDGGIDAADPGNNEASWFHPQESMCKGCHQTYSAHGGNIGDNGTSGITSCLDCHDPHGPAVGPTNITMIRGNIGATAAGKTQEATVYEDTADFYRAGPAYDGVCDNVNCHGATFASILADPTSPGYSEHNGRGVAVGFNCTACHKHDATTGGFMADCYDCHDYPPATGAHLRHKQIGLNCYDCHYGNNHNPTGVATTPLNFYTDYNRNQVEVAFNPTFNSTATNGSLGAPGFIRGATTAQTTCSNLTCHNPDNAYTGKLAPNSGFPPAGDETQNVPVWGSIYSACLDCHSRSQNAAEPAGKSHKMHDVTRGYSCSACHADVEVGQGVLVPARTTHGNKILETGQVVFAGGVGPVPLSGTYNNALDQCTNLYCHGTGTGPNYNLTGGTNQAANVPDWNVPASGDCGTCHGANNGTVTTWPTSVSHPTHAGSGGGQYRITCNICHVGTTNGTIITNQALHVNGLSEVSFDGTDPRIEIVTAPVNTYGGTATINNGGSESIDICSNLYCHGARAPFPATMAGTNTTPEWNVTLTGDCGTCHVDQASDFTAGVGSNAHALHAGDQFSNNYAQGCNICHYSVTTDGTTIAAGGTASHVNFQANVAFDGTNPRLNTNAGQPPVSSYPGDTTVGSGYGACNNTFCHSRARDLVRPFTDAPYTPVGWGDAITGSCTICHGGALSYGPSYPDGTLIDGTAKANKHQSHGYNALGYSCGTCHGYWTSIVPGEFRSKHVSGAYDASAGSWNDLDDFSFTPGVVAGGVNGTCTTVVCHGGNTVLWAENMSAAPWNANNNHFTCDICHGEVNGAPTNTDVNDFSIGVTTAGAVMSKVSASEYTTSGHGTGVNVGMGFPRAISRACRDCHDSTVTHEVDAANLSAASPLSPNPFRLRDQNAGAAGVQACSANATCHVAGTVGPATGKRLETLITHSDEGMGTDDQRTWPAWNPRCTECHDPHGDGTNRSMIQREVYDKSSTVQSLNTGGEEWGVPTTPNDDLSLENRTLVFTDNTTGIGAGSYAQTSPNFSGVCQECHERLTALNGVESFHDGPANGSTVTGRHPAADDCSICHNHDKAFSPSGCSGCHGNIASGQYWPDGALGNPSYADDDLQSAQKHDKHVLLIGLYLGYGNYASNPTGSPWASMYDATEQTTICAFCHPNPGGSNHATDFDPLLQATVYMDSDDTAGTPADVFRKFTVAAGSYGNDLTAANGDQAYDYAQQSCANLVCHNRQATPSVAGGFGWDGPGANPTCALCHPDGGGAGASGMHAVHTQSTQKNYACTECHINNGAYPGDTTPANLRHGNGAVDMAFTMAGSIEQVRGAANGFYDKDNTGTNVPPTGDTGFAYRDGLYGRACYNIYCHGGDNSGWGGSDLTPVWNDTASAYCGSCHDGNGTAPLPAGDGSLASTGSHTQHVSTSFVPGPALACGVCHTGSTLTTATHVNGQVGYLGGAQLPPAGIAADTTTITLCNACHGITTYDGETIKTNWSDAAANTYEPGSGNPDVTCESCHGGGDAAAVIAGVTAPARAGAAYTGSGHGKVTETAGVGRNCIDCHDRAAVHISGALGDNRLAVVNGQNYTTNSGDPFCASACHTVVAANVHFDNSHTPGGTSDNGNHCNICHDPHGMAGQDAMIVAAVPIGGAITGFADNTARASYANATFHGVCQSCHDSADALAHFNRVTNDTLHQTAAGVCTACHKHTSPVAFSANCFDCHGDGVAEYWPQNAGNDRGTTTNAMFNNDGEHTLHIARLATRLGFTPPGNDAQQRATCAYCHVIDDNDHTSLLNATQAEVFVSNLVRGAKSMWNAADTDAAFTQADYSCQNVDCHDNQNTAATYNWYTGSNSACVMCHINITVAASDLNAHVSHTGSSTIYGRVMGCNDCHVAGVVWNTLPGLGTAPATGHIDGTWTIQGLAVSYNGSWPTTRGSCGAGGQNSCHTNGAGGLPVTTAYSWGIALNNDCATCHQGAAMAGQHAAHLNSNALPGTNLTYNGADQCVACHSTSTSGFGRAIVSGAHLNQSVEVVFSPTYDFEAAGGAVPAGTGAAMTCADIRCHNGVTTPTWGTTGIICGQCHGNGSGTPNSEPAPTVPASVLGSHPQHIDALATNYTDCDWCHGGAGALVSATYTAAGGGGASLLHQNLTVDVYINSSANRYTESNGKGGVNYAGTDYTDNGSCSLTICHGTGVPVWGSGPLPGNCFSCHVSTGELGTKPLVNAIQPNPVNETEYNTQGHGRTAGTYTGSNNPFAGYPVNGVTNNCFSCHSAASQHSPSPVTDPFRLGAYATNTDGLCLATCHGPGGSAANHDMQTHSQAVLGNKYTWPFSSYAFKCVDCHDPHGDANLVMVRSSLDVPTTPASVNFGSDLYGTPRNAGGTQAVTFNSMVGLGPGSYGITGIATDGICEVCHTQTTYWRKDIPQEAHEPTTKCTNCHNHEKGLKATCYTCHGDTVGGTYYYPDTASAAVGDFPDRAGKHLKHINRIVAVMGGAIVASDASTCNWCHPNGGHSGDALTPAELHPGGAGTHFRTISGLTDSGDTVAQSGTNVTCAGVNCHYNTTPPIAEWYGASTATCDYCHYGNVGNYATNQLPGSHNVHVDEVAGNGYDYLCSYCHPSGGYANNHQTGVVNWDFAGALDPVRGGPRAETYNGTATGTTTVKYATVAGSACANVYCHGEFAYGGKTTNDPIWANVATGDCGTCHGDTAPLTNELKAYPRSGGYTVTHQEHVVSNSQPGCSACHDSDNNGASVGLGTFGDEVLHVNGSINLALGTSQAKGELETVNYEAATATYNGIVGDGAGATDTCLSVRCHNGVLTPSFQDGTTIACGDCHGVAATDDPRPAGSAAGLHAGHANADATYTDCDNCHGDLTYSVSNARGASPYTVTGGGGAAGSGLHQNLAVDLWIASAANRYTDATPRAGVNWTAAGGLDDGTCSATGCHDNNDPTTAWNTAYTPADNCVLCHTGGTETVGDDAGTADVMSVQWLTDGHGSPAGGDLDAQASSGRQGCTFCHLDNIWTDHMPNKSATNPYRLHTAATAPAANTVCLNCHNTNSPPDPGYDPPDGSAGTVNGTKKVGDRHFNAQHVAGEGGQFCWDCHDPHGVATNILMVKQVLSKTSDSYGVPTAPLPTAVTFTNNLAATDYVDTTAPTEASSGICQKCHENKAGFAGEARYWRYDGTEDANPQDGTSDAGINDTNRHNQSQKCTTCHTHQAGFESSCSDCHGDKTTATYYYPDDGARGNPVGFPNRAGKHLKHINRIVAVMGGAIVATNASTCNWCHPNGGHSGDAVTPAELHPGGAGTHFRTISGLTDSGDTVAQSGTNVTCANVDCHYNTTPPIAEWYGASTATCDYCHYGNVGNYTTNQLPGSHNVHVDEVAGNGYDYPCSYCHPSGGYANNHQTGVVNWDFAGALDPVRGGPRAETYNGTATGTTTVKYATVAGSACANVYCHGEFAYGGKTTNDPIWANVATGDCGTCHGDTAPLTNELKAYPRSGGYTVTHQEHVVSNSQPGCSACHDSDNNGASVGLGTFGDEVLHVNGSINLALGTSQAKGELETVNYEAATATYNGIVGDGAGATDTCLNVRCHNGVLTPSFQDGTTIACGGCHNNGGTNPEPTMSLSVQGVHAGHVDAVAGTYTDCDNCHGDATYSVSNARGGSPYTVSGGGGAAGSGLHQDLAVQVWVAGANTRYADATPRGGVNWTAAGGLDDGTCSTTICHDNDNASGTLGTTQAWNTAYTPANNCLLCHANGVDAVADAAGADSMEDEWLADGHGSPAGGDLDAQASSGRQGCTFCHLDNIWTDHMPNKSVSNPYRLHTAATAPAANTVCLNCHNAAGDPGYDPPDGSVGTVNGTKKVGDTHFNSQHAAGEGGQFCWDCHDPHGVATNILMVKQVLSKTSDSYGVPTAPLPTAVTFTNNLAATDYVDTTAPTEVSSGICQKCHDNKAGFAGEARYWRNDGTEDANPQDGTTDAGINDTNRHNQSQKCTTCHLHTAGFEASCTDCHGDKLTGTYYYPDDGARGNPAGFPNRAGEHLKHITRIVGVMGGAIVATNSSTCNWCHPNGGHSGDAITPAELHPGGAGTHFRTINGLTDSGDTVAQSGTNVTCANVNCHYNRTPPIAEWYGGTTNNCSYCHAFAAYNDGDLPNAHDRHVDDNAGGGHNMNNFNCFNCHPDTAANNHQNGLVEISLNSTWPPLGEPGTTSATATGSDNAVKYGGAGNYATCNNLFCHGADTYVNGSGFRLYSGSKTTPKWDVPADGDCGTCHDTGTTAIDNSATILASGNHAAHLTEVWGPDLNEASLTSCDQCHPVYSVGPAPPYRASHVDGTINFLNLDNTTVTTLALTDTCNNCHGASVANAKTPANWANSSFRLGCLECHSSTTPANSLRDGSGVVAPAKNTSWTTRGHGNTTTLPWAPNRTGANMACTGCHNATSTHINGAPVQDRLTTAGNTLCTTCHDGPSGQPAVTQVSTHGNRSTTMGGSYTPVEPSFELNCVECHDVHGSSNIFMINTDNTNGPLVATRWYNNVINDFTNFLFRGTVAFTDNSVGTSATSGVGYAQAGAGNTTKICQTCHTVTGHYQYNSDNGHYTTDCMACHPHDFDATYTSGSQDAFMPKGTCEDCHNGSIGLAPNIVNGGAIPSGGNYNWYGTLAGQDGGHGDTGGATAVECTACHDIGQPTTTGTTAHGTGTYNSVFTNANRSTNTAHLKAEYFTKYPSNNPAGPYAIQVAFDNYCNFECHDPDRDGVPLDIPAEPANPMRHSSLTDHPLASPSWGASVFGTHLTLSPGDGIANTPVDEDINTDAPVGNGYAPCVSCHDPHGTTTPKPGTLPTNRMMRSTFPPYNNVLCAVCHI